MSNMPSHSSSVFRNTLRLSILRAMKTKLGRSSNVVTLTSQITWLCLE